MKKTNIILAALVASVAVIACNGGSSSSSGPAGPNVTQLTVPTGFTAGVSVGTGPVLYSAQNGLAVPTASGYQVVTLPQQVATALASGNAYQSAAIKGYNDGNLIITLEDGEVFVVTPTVSSNSAAKVASTAESYTIDQSKLTSNVVDFPGNSNLSLPAGIVYGTESGDNRILVLTTPNGVSQGSTYSISTAGCGNDAEDRITTLQPAGYNGTSYLGLGTAAGVVCVLSGASSTWTDMSAQAPAGKYTAGSISNLGFFANGDNLVGFWSLENGTIYQVNGKNTNGTIQGTQFWNMTKTGAQTSGGQTINLTTAPLPTDGSTTDTNGNQWVGDESGNIWVLRSGTATWTSAKIGNGAVTVYTTGGTGATATMAGTTTVYDAQ